MMSTNRLLAVATATLLAASLALAASPAHMKLTRDGSLYRLDTSQLGLTIEVDGAGEIIELLVPQTAAISAGDLNLDVDNRTGTVIVTWTEALGDDGDRLLLATWRDGTWFGPVEIASAEHPLQDITLLVQSLNELVTPKDGDDGSAEEIGSSFIHLAWWDGDADGHAVYSAIELTDEGVALVDGALVQPLTDLLPYGVQCDLPEDTSSLTPPRLFIDPETGDPHLLFVSLSDCMFRIQQIETHLEILDDDTTAKRRRHVIVFGATDDITISPELQLDNAQLAVGHGMSVVAWWEVSTEHLDELGEVDGVSSQLEYLVMDGEGWSPVRSLPVDDEVSRDQAIELVRSLALD